MIIENHMNQWLESLYTERSIEEVMPSKPLQVNLSSSLSNIKATLFNFPDDKGQTILCLTTKKKQQSHPVNNSSDAKTMKSKDNKCYIHSSVKHSSFLRIVPACKYIKLALNVQDIFSWQAMTIITICLLSLLKHFLESL